MEDDRQIWEDFKQDVDYALSAIYHRNVDFLFNYGKKFTNDENLVLDTIQDIFYDLIKNRKNLGNTNNIRMYLLKTFRRKLFRAFKKNKKLEGIDPMSEQHIPAIIFSVEEKMIHDEDSVLKLRMIENGMKKLNKRQREILYYKFTCGFDYPEICEIMSISYDTARQLVSRSIQLLKKTFPRNTFPF